LLEADKKTKRRKTEYRHDVQMYCAKQQSALKNKMQKPYF